MSRRQFKNLGRFTATIIVAAYVAGAAFVITHATSCATSANGPVKPAQFVDAVVKCTDVGASVATVGEVARCLGTQDPTSCVATVANTVRLTVKDVLCIAAEIRRGNCQADACTSDPTVAVLAGRFLAQNNVTVIHSDAPPASPAPSP